MTACARCTANQAAIDLLGRRIDSLQSDVAAEKAASADKLRQILLAVEYGNKLAEGTAPAVKAEPETARVYQLAERRAAL